MPAVNIGMPKPAPETLAPRRKSRQIKVGKVLVGGDAPVSVQSMAIWFLDLRAAVQGQSYISLDPPKA